MKKRENTGQRDATGGTNEGPKCIAESSERQSHLTCETLTQPHSQPRNPSGKI